MKHRLVRRVIASVMTALLVVGLIPMTFTGGGVKVSAADGKYVFDATTLTASADKEEIFPVLNKPFKGGEKCR